MAARIALPGLVVVIFSAVAIPHDVAMYGAESAQDPFAFDLRHQLVDAEIILVVFVGGEAAGGAVTVAAAGRCCRCNAYILQLNHCGHNVFVLSGGGRGQPLHHGGASGGCSGQGAKVAVKLLHKGCRGALTLTPERSCRGGGWDAVDEDGGVCGSEGVATARRQSPYPSKSFVEGEEVILPRLQGLVLGDFAIPLGAVLGGGARLEELVGCDDGEKVVQKGEAGALCLFLAFPDPV